MGVTITRSIAYALQCLTDNTFRSLNRWDGDDQRSCVACDYGVADDDPLAHTPPLTGHESGCVHMAHIIALRAFLRAENVLAEQQNRLDDVVMVP